MYRTIGQVANYKPLYKCNVEELAAIQQVRPSGGVLFARNPDREQKDEARQLIIDMFTRLERPEPMSFLTMPGLDWRFERKLLGKREGDWMRMEEPVRTKITAIENDRFIYYSATHKIPGIHTQNALTKTERRASYAERSMSTRFIERFHFANVDDLMAETEQIWDVVWLDYTGPLTVDRLRLISRFFDRCVSETIVVTAMRARYNRETSNAIERAGGHSDWVLKNFDGEVLHDIEYFDTCPMAQIAVRKAS